MAVIIVAGDSSLKGINQDVISLDAAVCLSQSECCGVLIKIASELVHGQGVYNLAGPILQMLHNQSFFKVITKLLEVFLVLGDIICNEL